MSSVLSNIRRLRHIATKGYNHAKLQLVRGLASDARVPTSSITTRWETINRRFSETSWREQTFYHNTLQGYAQLTRYNLMGFKLNNVVVPSIEKTALTGIASRLTLQYQLPVNDNDFASFVLGIVGHVFPADVRHQLKQYVDNIRKESLIKTAEQYHSGNEFIMTETDSLLQTIERARRVGRAGFSTNSTALDYALEIVADNHYVQQEMENEVDRLGDKGIAELAANGKLSPIDMSKPGEARLVKFLSGAPGSGKSLTMAQFLMSLKRDFGVDESHIGIYSIDRFRRLFYPSLSKKGGDIGTLTHLDAVSVYNKAIAHRRKRLLSGQSVQRVTLLDQSVPYDSVVGDVIDGDDDVTTIISVVDRDADKSVLGTLERSQKSSDKRVMPPVVTLSRFQDLSQVIPELINKYQGQKVMIRLYNTEARIKAMFSDGNTLETPIKPFMVVDCIKGKVVVNSLTQLHQFMQKRHLDPMACSPQTLFGKNAALPSLKDNVKTMLQSLLSFDIEIRARHTDGALVTHIERDNQAARARFVGELLIDATVDETELIQDASEEEADNDPLSLRF